MNFRVVVAWRGTDRTGTLAGESYANSLPTGARFVPVRFDDTGETVPDVDTRIVRPAPVWFVWHGGGNYAVGYLSDALETADSVADVVDICEARMSNRDGRTPCVDVSSCAHVFYADPSDSDDPYPDLMVELVGGEYVPSPC